MAIQRRPCISTAFSLPGLRIKIEDMNGIKIVVRGIIKSIATDKQWADKVCQKAEYMAVNVLL